MYRVNRLYRFRQFTCPELYTLTELGYDAVNWKKHTSRNATVGDDVDRFQGRNTIRLKQWLREIAAALGRWWKRQTPVTPQQPLAHLHQPGVPQLFQRLVLTQGVCQTLFQEVTAHHQTDRGHEETGWLLLGFRNVSEAIGVATIPAGLSRDAAEAHVKFASDVQELAQRIIRQDLKQLRVLGVIHTHPGHLRHPSSADYRGDITWVANLFGNEGVFGIGTVEHGQTTESKPYEIRQQHLRFSWYALHVNDRNYRRISVELVPGPDVGHLVRSVWHEIEWTAPVLNPLLELIHKSRLEIIPTTTNAMLNLTIKHPSREMALLIEIERDDCRYWLLDQRQKQPQRIPLSPEHPNDRVDLNVLSLCLRLFR